MRILVVLVVASFLISCDRGDSPAVAPSIEFLGLSKDTILQGRQEDDSLYISISFEDDDGDIGNDSNEPTLFLKDSRDGSLSPFSVPLVPQQGSSNGVSGEITILVTSLFNICCFFESGLDPCSVSPDQKFDEMTFLIQLVDRAGNQSNEVETSPIVIRCD
jgi:hypothetical protein